MNFDRLARHYDWLEAFLAGDALQRARTVWLAELAGRKRILSVGEGHGKFAAACRARFPGAELTCVEASPAMLARAQRRIGPGAPGITWHCGDVLAWDGAGPFDAIVTCFFLDCFPPEMLCTVIESLAGRAAPDAIWLQVDFALPARGFPRWRARAVHWLMYAFFRPVVGLPARRLTPPDELLRQRGFEPTVRRDFNWGLVRAEVWRRSGR